MSSGTIRTDRHHTALPFIGGVVLAVWPPCRDTVRTPEFVHLLRSIEGQKRVGAHLRRREDHRRHTFKGKMQDAEHETLHDDDARDEIAADQTAILAACWKNQTCAPPVDLACERM